MQEYELTVVIHPDHEANKDKVMESLRDLVKGNGGVIKKEDEWGKKKLAYPIKKQAFGLYVLFDVELPPAAPLKISNTLNITDEVMRYLLVKTDDKVRSKVAAAKKNAGEDSEEE